MIAKPLEYEDELIAVIKRLDESFFKEAIKIFKIVHVEDNFGRTFVIGNGGNASTASHFACDLQKGLSDTIKPRVISLVDNVALLTAWSNDYNFEATLSNQLIALAEWGDLLFAFSASGKSQNILNCINYANQNGIFTIGITGLGGQEMEELCDCCLIIDTYDMQIIEDVTLIACHMLFRKLLENTNIG